jgi:hypothetical protein
LYQSGRRKQPGYGKTRINGIFLPLLTHKS